MVDLIEFEGVELATKRHLDRHLGGTRVASKVPNPRPDRLVRVVAAGGSDRSMVVGARLVIVQCWDRSEVDAMRLAERCFAVLKAAARDPLSPDIRHVVTVGAPQFFPDPDTALPRYQFTVQLHLRGAVTN